MDPQIATTSAIVPSAIARGNVALLMLLVVREMVWKGIALWKAGTKKQVRRFICIFIFNTVGILPIIYLAFFQKKGLGPVKGKK
jgi:hypothetical protein